MLMLTLFLNWHSALWVALSIPVVLLGTLFMLPVFGTYLDTIAMGAMILVIGIIVDDGIVVFESPIDLDVTMYVQSLVVNGDGFVGFVARHNNSGVSGLPFPRWRLRTSTDSNVAGLDLRPRLLIVPEPSNSSS